MPDTMMAAPVALPMQLRRAPILPATVNSEARSVDVVFTTGAAVRRRRWTGWDTSVPFDEILEVSERAVDLTRLNAGAPALDSHSVWSSHSQVGVVERAWIEGKEGKATIRFPREGLDQAADRMFGLISDGIIRNVSVGYSIERVKVVESATKGEVERRIVERWTPLEVSFVTVPADPRAQVRAADQASYPVEIVDTRMQKEASMPESTTNVAGDAPVATETRQPPVAAPAQPEPAATRMPDAPAAPDSEAIATRARDAERDRVSTIYDLTGRLNLERSFAEDLVKRGVSVDESRRLILDQVAAKSDETRTFGHVSVPLGGRDERITRRDGMIAGADDRDACAGAPTLHRCDQRQARMHHQPDHLVRPAHPFPRRIEPIHLHPAEIAARTEGPGGSGDHRGTDCTVGLEFLQRLDEGSAHRHTERVAPLGHVHGQHRDRPVAFDQQRGMLGCTHAASLSAASVRACNASSVMPGIMSRTTKPSAVTSSTARLV